MRIYGKQIMLAQKHILRFQEKLGFKAHFPSPITGEVYGDYNGFMTEDVMVNNKISDTYQMNDYAITKWAGEHVFKFHNYVWF